MLFNLKNKKKFFRFLYLYILFILVLIIVFNINLYAQEYDKDNDIPDSYFSNALTIGMGFSIPFGFGPGYYFEATFGRDYDESVFYGVGLDFFFTSIRWSSFNTNYSDSTTFVLPMYLNLRVRLPLRLPFAIFISGGMGYSFMFDFVKLVSSVQQTSGIAESTVYLYGSFYWQIKIGMGLMLGSRTDGQIEFVLSSFNFTRFGEYNELYPSKETIDMLNISIIFSIRFFRM